MDTFVVMVPNPSSSVNFKTNDVIMVDKKAESTVDKFPAGTAKTTATN